MPIPSIKTDTTLEMKRTFKASRKRLYDAWTDPNLLAKWFHPASPMHTTVSELSLRPGGRYRFIMHGDRDHIVGGVYREVVPQEKLVFTWQWESEDESAEMLVTIRFNKIDAQNTELVLTHERFPHIEERDSHEWGWNGTLEQLAKVL